MDFFSLWFPPLDPDFYSSWILDPKSWIADPTEKGEKIICPSFFVATNITKFKMILFFNRYRKNCKPIWIFKELWYFKSQKLLLSSQNMVPGSEKKPIPDTGVKKAPDPADPGSVTLHIWCRWLRMGSGCISLLKRFSGKRLGCI